MAVPGTFPIYKRVYLTYLPSSGQYKPDFAGEALLKYVLLLEPQTLLYVIHHFRGSRGGQGQYRNTRQ